MDEPMILHPDQADELRRLLGTVEDWLLHTSPEVIDDLGGFLTGLGWGIAAPQQLVTWLIHATGNALAPAWYWLGSGVLGLIGMALIMESAPARTFPVLAPQPAA